MRPFLLGWLETAWEVRVAIKYVGGAAARRRVITEAAASDASHGEILREAAGRIAAEAAQVEQRQRERVSRISDEQMRYAVQTWRSKLAG